MTQKLPAICKSLQNRKEKNRKQGTIRVIKRWVCELSPKSWTSKKGPEAVHEEASDKWHRRSAGVILFKFHR